MKLSKAGLLFIKSKEGWENKVYLDSAGLSTIGVGHLIMTPVDKHLTEVTGKDPRVIVKLTDDEVLKLLQLDVAIFERLINEEVKVELTQNQFDALVAFVFNVGAGAFKKSTLLRKLNEEKPKEVLAEFLKWVNAGKKYIKGLYVVRVAESKIFNNDYTEIKKDDKLDSSSLEHLNSLVLGYKLMGEE